MNIEERIFARMKIDYKKLLEYGFVKKDNIYKFSKQFMDNAFRAEISITDDGKILGKVYDVEFGDEYTNFRIEDSEGEFVGKVKEDFENILKDIANKCCIKQYFLTKQANRITDLIIKKYGNIPEFAWDKSPGNGIFRNPINEKWYGLIMNINKSKIDEGNEEVEILNVKLNEDEILKLLNTKGFYPAYHMNKKSWISIILDGTLPDKVIMNYIEESHMYTDNPKKRTTI